MFYNHVKVTLMISIARSSSFLLLNMLLLIQTSVMGMADAYLGRWFHMINITAICSQDLEAEMHFNKHLQEGPLSHDIGTYHASSTFPAHTVPQKPPLCSLSVSSSIHSQMSTTLSSTSLPCPMRPLERRLILSD